MTRTRLALGALVGAAVAGPAGCSGPPRPRRRGTASACREPSGCGRRRRRRHPSPPDQRPPPPRRRPAEALRLPRPAPASPSTPPVRAGQRRTAASSDGSCRQDRRRDVALTFDDGPDAPYTPQLLAMLRQYHIKATFCLIGVNVQRASRTRPGRSSRDGHTLCNHTWKHDLHLGKKSAGRDPRRPSADQRRDPQGGPRREDQVLPPPGRQLHPAPRCRSPPTGHASLGWTVDPSTGTPGRAAGGRHDPAHHHNGEASTKPGVDRPVPRRRRRPDDHRRLQDAPARLKAQYKLIALP